MIVGAVPVLAWLAIAAAAGMIVGGVIAIVLGARRRSHRDTTASGLTEAEIGRLWKATSREERWRWLLGIGSDDGVDLDGGDRAARALRACLREVAALRRQGVDPYAVDVEDLVEEARTHAELDDELRTLLDDARADQVDRVRRRRLRDE